MTMNTDVLTSTNTMRDGRIGLLLRVAPSTPGKERRRSVVTCSSLDELSTKIEEERFKRESNLGMSKSFSSSYPPVAHTLRNQCEENPCRMTRKPSMNRSNESLERWSDSIGIIGTGPRKYDSSPSFPSRSERTVYVESSTRQVKMFMPSLSSSEEAIEVKGITFTATSQADYPSRPRYPVCKNSGPPINIDCVQPCKGLEHEDLTDMSLDDDDFPDSF